MTGSLWFVYENEDGIIPISLKEFKENIDADAHPEQLSRGNIIPQNEKMQQHIIFDCFRPEYDETLSFRLYLYDDGTIEGKIEYPIDYNVSKEYFRGNYKLNSKSKISIWGVWSVDADFKETNLIFIELTK